MGLNIAGLAIQDNFNKDIKLLGQNLEWGIDVIESITFEEASENRIPKDEFRLYFSENATLLFYDHSWYDNEYYSQTANSLNYHYFSIGMLFMMQYTVNNKLVREIQELERERKYEKGRKLPVEKNAKFVDEIIFNLIEEIIGSSLNSIDPKAQAYRCRRTTYRGPKTRMTEEEKRNFEIDEEIRLTFNSGYDDLFQF